jgi:hypothetical protein
MSVAPSPQSVPRYWLDHNGFRVLYPNRQPPQSRFSLTRQQTVVLLLGLIDYYYQDYVKNPQQKRTVNDVASFIKKNHGGVLLKALRWLNYKVGRAKKNIGINAAHVNELLNYLSKLTANRRTGPVVSMVQKTGIQQMHGLFPKAVARLLMTKVI